MFSITPCLTLLLLLRPASEEKAIERPELAKVFVAQMDAGDFDRVIESFDPTMQKGLSAEQLRQLWNGLASQYGPFQRAGAVTTEKIGKYDCVYVTCEFQRGKLDAKIVFDGDKRITGLFFVPSGRYQSPAYVDRAKFEEKEVQIGKGLVSLPGTLSLPKGDGPFPAVLLVHGSGPNDRDETYGPNKPLRDVAQGLASRGVAVLRYEKRTKHYPVLMALSAANITVKEETIDDALAAVAVLAGQEKIDPQRVFVLGHSLGGSLLPRIGKGRTEIAGFISLAGATRALENSYLEQVKYLLSQETGPKEAIHSKLEEVEQQVARVKSPELSADTPASDLPLGIPAKYWLDLRGYKPAEVAKGLPQPMLFLQGERDYQVTLDDLAGWKKALAGRTDVSFRTYPKLNHLFMEGEGKCLPMEYLVPGNVAKAVIDDIADWIGKVNVLNAK